MEKKKWEAEVRLSSDLETADGFLREIPDLESKLVIGVIADLKGTAGSGSGSHFISLQKRKFVDIDIDNFDEVLAGLAVSWSGRLSGLPDSAERSTEVRLEFRTLEDFHPDRIVQMIPELRSVHEWLAALDDPARFDDAVDRVTRWAGVDPITHQRQAAPAPQSPPPEAADRAGILESILDKTSAVRAPMSDMDRMVREIVTPHLNRVDERRREELVRGVTHTLSNLVNSVLLDPSFRRLEALWRSLRRLVDIAGDETRVCIAQLTRDELLHEVISGISVETSTLARMLGEPASTPEASRISMLVGSYEFSRDLEDLALLERLGMIGAGRRIPLITAASARFFGVGSFTELPPAGELEKMFAGSDYQAWRLLRQTPPARWLALAAPRLICRLPYGPGTDAAESFQFEERVTPGDPDGLVWGNPAFGVASLVAGAFAREGWQMDPEARVARLEGLPLYLYRKDGETVSQPCAEMLLGESTVEIMMAAGLLPLASHRDMDVVSMPVLQTIANPRAPIRF